MEKSKSFSPPVNGLPLHRRVRKLITAGEFPPGSQLSPTILADRFGVSPTPVRESLNRLVGEGLLEEKKGGGYTTPMPSARQLQYQMELLITLLKIALVSRIGNTQKSSSATLAADRLDHQDSADKVADALLALFHEINARHANRALAESLDNLIGRCACALRIYLRDHFHRRHEVRDARALVRALDHNDLARVQDLVTGFNARFDAEAERVFQCSLKDRYEADEDSVDRFY